eukprot:Hpha_TRINITY_DN12730_c0_g1::TRINITY_DN12730_c0_g1_i2::g.114337::m.114337/K13095/SF1; splicing factor 1
MHRVIPLGVADPADDRPTTRWSADRIVQQGLPTNVPHELLEVARGDAFRVFLLRAQIQDMQRIADQQKEEEWYQMLRKRKRDEAPVYNQKGERVNTAQNIFRDRKMKLVQELLAASARYNQRAATSDQRITKKVYFTRAQVESRAYGAIFGARGRTHQEIQMVTGCKITLMGRGISDELKNKQVQVGREDEHRAGMDDAPHAHITAPNEEALKKAVERIEFLVSDRPEAIEVREAKRKEVAILNGTFRPETWRARPTGVQPSNQVQASVFSGPAQASRNISAQDAEYRQFMAEVDGKA